MTAVQVRDLRKSFVQHLRGGSRREVLRGIDLDIPAGASVVFRGPSGCGKSSLLRCLYGTYRPDAGTVELRGLGRAARVDGATEAELLAIRDDMVGFVTQFLEVVPRVSSLDLVAEEGMSRDEAAGLLEELGLAPALATAPPATFSGGERQLVNLAITLARRRPILLLDEATASLDHERRRRVYSVLERLKGEGTTLVGVFHDMPTSPGLVDEVIEMHEGRITRPANRRSTNASG